MLKIITAPASEPVSLVDIVNYTHLEEATDAVEVAFRQGLITAAREYCEAYQRRSYITQTLEMALDKFPTGVINIPRGNLQEIVSVKYTDSDGVDHVLSEGVDYVYSTYGATGRILPVTSWPSGNLYPLDAVKIQFTCGYGFSYDVPFKVKQAMFMLISYWYDNRSAVTIGTISKEAEFSVKALLGFERIGVPDASRRA